MRRVSSPRPTWSPQGGAKKAMAKSRRVQDSNHEPAGARRPTLRSAGGRFSEHPPAMTNGSGAPVGAPTSTPSARRL